MNNITNANANAITTTMGQGAQVDMTNIMYALYQSCPAPDAPEAMLWEWEICVEELAKVGAITRADLLKLLSE